MFYFYSNYINYSGWFPVFLQMKFNTHWQFKIVPLISSSKLLIKCASTKPVLKSSGPKQSKKNLVLPELPKERIQKLEDITSIVVAYNYVSWAKISVPTLTLLDWNYYATPDFQKTINELIILKGAHEVVSNLPDSELYVMESQPGKWIRNLNDYSLKSMLIALLSLKGVNNSENIVFQNPYILNKSHNLLIGGERISAKDIINQKVRFHSRKYENAQQESNDNDCFSLININPEKWHSYATCSEAQQGGLSLALLLALTFIDLNVFQYSEVLYSKK